MKKKIAVVSAALILSVSTFAAEITFDIPNEQLPRIVDAMSGLYEIPDADKDGIPDFTGGQWGKEVVRRWIISQVQRWETKVAMEAARKNVLPDDTIAQ